MDGELGYDKTYLYYLKNNFTWIPEKGMGHYPVPNLKVYDRTYFRRYQNYFETEMGKKLTQARIDFVRKHWTEGVVDIGIGCGSFMEMHGNAKGFDVNPEGVKWLREKNLFHDPYQNVFQAGTFFDSLEHIEKPADLLIQVLGWAFVSIPIFKDGEHVLKSKHFRKNEHRWYFTDWGLKLWMANQGFTFVDCQPFEMALGREDIYSYAFKRMEP